MMEPMADGAPLEPPESTEVSTTGSKLRSPAARQIRRGVKILAFAFVINYLVIPQIAGARKAAEGLLEVRPEYLVLGLLFQGLSLLCYSLLTRACLPPRSVGIWTLLRIQLSTKAVTNVVPGGSAAGSALGFRFLTLAGVRGADAGFAMATAGLGSAVVLNLILWVALLLSIPTRGFNPLYVTVAIIGVVMMGTFALIVVGLMKGQARAERALRAIARKVKWLDEDKAGEVVNRLALRIRELLSNPALLRQVILWASLNWLLDAASLWVFLYAFGFAIDPVGLLVSYGIASVMAVIPITPGGLGIVEGVMIPLLVGFGVPRSVALLGVPAWRLAQFWLPIPLGALAYFSLRFGPAPIDRARTMPTLRKEREKVVASTEPGINWMSDPPRWADDPGDGGAEASR
jgi:putative heme transporter